MNSNTRDWEIRIYEPRDRDPVSKLWGRVFPDPAEHNRPPRIIDAKSEVQSELFYVATLITDPHRIIGTTLAGYDGHRGWLYQVAVDPAYRGNGLGSALIRYAQTELKKLGCEKINLQVRAENAAVVGFYETLGFSVESRVNLGKRI